MEPRNEAAVWASLQQELEGKLSEWNVPNPRDHAEGLVGELRDEGWRAPTPDRRVRTESWKRQRTNHSEAAQRHIAACREAIRSATVYG